LLRLLRTGVIAGALLAACSGGDGSGDGVVVSNDHSGDIRIDRSVITNNVGGSWYPTYPQISNHDDTRSS